MNLKRTFGTILTLQGITGLIYTALLFSRTSGNNQDIRMLIVYSVLGALFFTSGISLVTAKERRVLK